MKRLAVTVLWIITMLCLAAAGQTPGPKTLDRSDAAATAQAVLKAYAAKDLPAMAELSAADNREVIQELIKQRENHPRWRSVFLGGRWEAVSNWNGKLGEVRYFERTASGVKHVDAQVHFAQAQPDKLVVLSLSWEDGKWCFQDVNFPRRESFEQGSKARPAMP